MRFQVPQFIEHEAKVIGPFTFKQFIYLGVPGAIAFFLYFLTPFFVFIITSIILLSFGLMFAFLKIGGRSLTTIVLNFFNFTIGPKRYIWSKAQPTTAAELRAGPTPAQSASRIEAGQPQASKREIKLVQKSKIKDLSTRIDTTR